MKRHCFHIALIIASLGLSSLCSTAEMGVHWWPAGNAAWEPRTGHIVVAFKDSLWLVGGLVCYEMEWCEGDYTPCTECFYSGGVWQSNDGTNWTYAGTYSNLPFVSTIRAAIKDDKLWLIGKYASSAEKIISSPDGITWTTVSINPPRNASPAGFAAFQGNLWIHRLAYDPLEGESYNYREIWRSPDGVGWERIFPSGEVPLLTHNLIEYKGQLCALGEASTDNWFSDNAIEWSPLPLGENGYEGFLILDIVQPLLPDGRLWLVGEERSNPDVIRLIYSEDAVNWHAALANTAFPSRSRFATVAWNNRIWIFGGQISPLYHSMLNDIWYSEDTPLDIHRADYEADGAVSLSELLRVVQLYQAGKYQCDGTTEDSYAPGRGYETCFPHSSDYAPQDWSIDLRELLRLIQFYNTGGYHYCPDSGTEDGFCPGP